MIKILDKIICWIYGAQNIFECECGQLNEINKNECCTNCDEPLKLK